MQYTYKLSHSIELSRFSNLLMPNSNSACVALNWAEINGGQLTPTPEDILEPSHGRVFREKFRSVYVVKGVWSLLTDLFLNRPKIPKASIPKIKAFHEWGFRSSVF